MAVDIKPLDELQLWSRPRPGQLPRWVQCVIVLACVVTVVVVGATTHVLWRMDGGYQNVDKWTFRNGPPLIMLIVLAVAFLPSSSVSRFVRMALVVPLVHVLTLIVAWRLIPVLEMPLVGERTPLTRELPVLPMTLLIAGATITIGALVWRGIPERCTCDDHARTPGASCAASPCWSLEREPRHPDRRCPPHHRALAHATPR